MFPSEPSPPSSFSSKSSSSSTLTTRTADTNGLRPVVPCTVTVYVNVSLSSDRRVAATAVVASRHSPLSSSSSFVVACRTARAPRQMAWRTPKQLFHRPPFRHFSFFSHFPPSIFHHRHAWHRSLSLSISRTNVRFDATFPHLLRLAPRTIHVDRRIIPFITRISSEKSFVSRLAKCSRCARV